MKATHKRKKKSETRKRKEELDKICLDIVRIRDGGICNWCGKNCGCLQHHHIIPVSVGGNACRWDLQDMVCMGSGCHMFGIKKKPIEYADWIRKWLNDRDLNYEQLRSTYKGAYVKFNKEYYEVKKSVLEDILEGL